MGHIPVKINVHFFLSPL